jgi:hypothetical protein
MCDEDPDLPALGGVLIALTVLYGTIVATKIAELLL